MSRVPRFTVRPTWKPGEVWNPLGTIDLTVEIDGVIIGRIYSGAGARGDKWSWTMPGHSGGLTDDLAGAKRAIWNAWRKQR